MKIAITSTTLLKSNIRYVPTDGFGNKQEDFQAPQIAEPTLEAVHSKQAMKTQRRYIPYLLIIVLLPVNIAIAPGPLYKLGWVVTTILVMLRLYFMAATKA